MGIVHTIKEYAKLARSFNAALTGTAPVLGAISMGVGGPAHLILLFLVGTLGHIYGFTHNDVVDVEVDRLSDGLADRPLVSGTISRRGALGFACGSMALAFILAWSYFSPWALLALAISALLVTIYNLVSKKMTGADVILAGGVGGLILFGVLSAEKGFSPLSMIVVSLGFFQVLFMNVVAGGLKDAEGDRAAGARTIAVRSGVMINGGRLKVPPGFRALAHSLEGAMVAVVLAPFIFLGFFQHGWQVLQLMLLLFLGLAMFVVSERFMEKREFDRNGLRMSLGTHYQVNYSLAPVLLMAVNPFVLVLMFVPPGGFILSNRSLHGTWMKPMTM